MAAVFGYQPPKFRLGPGPTFPRRGVAAYRRVVHPDIQEAEDALRRAAVHAASGAVRGREAEVARLHTGCEMSSMECVRRCETSRVGLIYSMKAELAEVTEVLLSIRDVVRRRLGEKVLEADVRIRRGAVRSAASPEEGPRGGERRVQGSGTPAPRPVSEGR